MNEYDQLIDLLGTCGCGDPGRVLNWVGNYLELMSLKGPPDYTSYAKWYDETYKPTEIERFCAYDSDAFWAAAYIADMAKLTEHGGSVRSAWLETKGETFLELWRMWKTNSAQD